MYPPLWTSYLVAMHDDIKNRSISTTSLTMRIVISTAALNRPFMVYLDQGSAAGEVQRAGFTVLCEVRKLHAVLTKQNH